MRYFDRFNSDFITVRFQISTGNLCNPRILLGPDHSGLATFIQQTDGDGASFAEIHFYL